MRISGGRWGGREGGVRLKRKGSREGRIGERGKMVGNVKGREDG